MKKQLLLSSAFILLTGSIAFGQGGTATNFSLIQNQFLGFNGISLGGGIKNLQIRNDYNRPITFHTNNQTLRMKLNGSISYSINGIPAQNRDGYLLLGQNNDLMNTTTSIYDPNFGAYSLLHLNGIGSVAQQFGYRNWMHAGMTVTGNQDLAYFGLRRLHNNQGIIPGIQEDATEAVIAWADNNSTDDAGFSSDDLVFRFIGRPITNANGIDANLQSNSDLDGLHIARFTSRGNIGFGNTFGVNAPNLTSPVTYATPQNLLHMSLDGNKEVFLQITNQSGTGQGAGNGLRIGYPTTTNLGLIRNMPVQINQQENDKLLLMTRGGERINITQIGGNNFGVLNFNPGGIPDNRTRIGISHNPATPVTRPLSLLHLGYNTASTLTNDGWRPWMDVGMYISQQSDNVFLGLKPEPTLVGDRTDAVLSWGDNQTNTALVNGPDNFRFIFTSNTLPALGGSLPAIAPNGLEGMRMTPTTNQGIRVGIGGDPTVLVGNTYFGGSINPTATLEVNAWGGVLTTLQPGGNSGLRFTNLTSATPPNPLPNGNPPTGVLSVNATGDVIYVPANNTPAIGNYCPDPDNPITNDFEIPLDGLSYNFTAGTGPDASRVNMGNVPCGIQANARLFVFENESMPDTNGVSAIVGYVDGVNINHTSLYGVTGGVTNSKRYEHAGISGFSTNAINGGGPWLSKGVGVFGVSVGSEENVGVFGQCIDNSAAVYNYAIYGEASNASIASYAGYFEGDVKINGSGWVNGIDVITSDKNLKKQISPIHNALSTIKKLKPTSYFMDTLNPFGLKLATNKQYGLIAQDVELVLPELVHSTSVPARRDSTGKLKSRATTYKGIEYNAFISIIIAAMQEQQAQLENKDSEISNLKAKDSILSSRLSALETCINNSNLCNKKVKKSLIEENEEANTNSHTTEITLTDLQYIILDQNVPNPFAEQTSIGYFLPEDIKKAQVVFHNADGKLINSLTITERGRGSLNVYADDLSSGVYSYTLIADRKVIDT